MYIEPIGIFQCAEKYPYDAARQGALAQDNAGKIVLNPGQNFEQALQELEGFSHIWLLFQFHHNTGWKPLVQPPRSRGKVGVFASRAPYRPNPIGLSCVRLLSISGRTVRVADHDLLDGTPILDIKPYIPYGDSIPEAKSGWLEELREQEWQVTLEAGASAQVEWLEAHGVDCLAAFLRQQLTTDPFNRKRKRIKRLAEDEWELAYRTWRVRLTVDYESVSLQVEGIRSGYSEDELADVHDPYEDKTTHREFMERFSS